MWVDGPASRRELPAGGDCDFLGFLNSCDFDMVTLGRKGRLEGEREDGLDADRLALAEEVEFAAQRFKVDVGGDLGVHRAVGGFSGEVVGRALILSHGAHGAHGAL